MSALATFYAGIFGPVERIGTRLLPLGARFVFAATLLSYYWHSAATKLGDGTLGPAMGAYAQVFPRQFEAVGYDATRLSDFHWLAVVAGTWAEFALPALIVLGLATRLAALGMVGFVLLQSLTDIFGHGMTDAATLGAWFDRFPGSVIMDQRLFWVFILSVLAIRGAGALSLDAVLRRRTASVPA